MELTKAKFTTREIADSLGEKVGAVRTVAFRLFDRGEFDIEDNEFVFTAEQADKIEAIFKKESQRENKVLVPNVTKTEMTLASITKSVSSEKFMTVRELAGVLGVSERTIRDTAKNKGVEGSFHTFGTAGGNQSVKVFNEEEVTTIKQEIEKHHNLSNRQVDSVTTQLEVMQKIQEGYELTVQLMNEYKSRAEKAERKIEEIQPDADSWNTYAGNHKQREVEKSFREVAKLLQIDPQYKLTDFLAEKGFIYRDKHNTWTASQKGLQAGVVVNRTINNGAFSGEQCKVTTKGMKKLSEWKSEGAFDGNLIKERNPA